MPRQKHINIVHSLPTLLLYFLFIYKITLLPIKKINIYQKTKYKI